MKDLYFKDETYALRGAVYNEKGAGFLENGYQECLELDLVDQDVAFVSKALNYLQASVKQLGILVNLQSYPRLCIGGIVN